MFSSRTRTLAPAPSLPGSYRHAFGVCQDLIGGEALPEAFQRLLVRPSIWCYPYFSLAKGRSLGFASACPDCTPSSDSLSLRLRGSSRLTSPETATRRFIMQKARRHACALRPLVGAWFQGLFHSSVRSAFHLSLTVLVHYRSLGSI